MYPESLESCPDSEDLKQQNLGAADGGREARWEPDVLCHFALEPHADSKLNGQDLGAGPCQSSLEKINKSLSTRLWDPNSCLMTHVIRNPEPTRFIL